ILLEKGKSTPKSFTLSDGRELEVFIELLPPEINVILMGQQYDVYPLVRLIREVGWRATVVANSQKITPKLSTLTNALVAPEDFETLLIDQNTAIVLMSHDFKTDKYNLPKALKTAAPYIGMLGPRVRSEKILNELSAENTAVSNSDLPRIHAPAGLDIGALSPEEIALSIVAEIRAVFSERDGSFLRLRQGTIHER
ncbi:MAG: XshC-Cox1 family protein, partial [Runella slithyformis]